MAATETNYIRAALEKGDIPDYLRDALHLITEGKEAQQFQSVMKEKMRELVGAQEADRLNVRFVLSGDNSLNAGVIRYSKPPIMIFTKPLLEALKEDKLRDKVDELHTHGKYHGGRDRVPVQVPPEFVKNGKGMLMGILAHEVNHIYKGNENSKGIEGSGDVYAVEKLIELGYREDSLIEARNFLFYIDPADEGKYSRAFNELANYLDVHLKPDNAIRAMEHKKFTALENDPTGFATDAAKKRIPPTAQALEDSFFDVTKAPYQTYVQTLLTERGYEGKDRAGKLDVLHDIIKTELPTWDENNHSPRFKEFCAEFEKVKNYGGLQSYYSYGGGKGAKEEGVAAKKAIDAIANTVLGVDQPHYKAHWYDTPLYETVARVWHGDHGRQKPLGVYEQLAGQMSAFVKATNAGAASKAAIETERLVKAHHLRKDHDNNLTLELPQFYPPSEGALLDIEKRIYKKTGTMPQIQAIPAATLAEIEKENTDYYSSMVPPWKAHTDWAAAENGASRPITSMLIRMGVNDRIDSRLLPSFRPSPLLSDDIAGNIIVGEGGYIVGLPRNHYSLNDAHEKALRERAALIDKLGRGKTDISSIDWEPVRSCDRKKLSDFCYQYRNELTPDVRKQMPATPFEKKFTEELETALKDMFRLELKDPDEGDAKSAFKPRIRDSFEDSVAHFFQDTAGRIGSIMDTTPEGAHLDKSHPYVGFVQRNPGGALQLYERAMILELTLDSKYRQRDMEKNLDMAQPVAQDIAFFRTGLGYTAPATTGELLSFYDYIDQDRDVWTRSTRNVPLLKALAEHETIEFLKNHPEAHFTAEQLNVLYYVGKDGQGLLKPSFEKALSGYIDHHHKEELKLGAAELIHAYNLHMNSQFFRQRVDLREVYEKTIKEKVDKVQNADEKQHLLEMLLLSDEKAPPEIPYFNYFEKEPKKPPTKFLNNPEFRKWAIDGWVELAAVNTAKEAGINGTADDTRYDATGKYERASRYYTKACPLVDKVLARSDGIMRSAMLTQFLNRVEAQEPLSFHVRDRLNDVAETQLANLHYQVSAGEVFLDHLAYDADLRKKTIEFLRAPLTADSAANYARAVRQSTDSALRQKAHELPALKFALESARTKAELYDQDARVSTYAAEMLHKNFTNAPTEHRTPMMEVLLFPPNQNATPMHGTTPQKYVFDTVLPESEQFSKFGRSLFSHYLGSLKPDEDYIKRMYLAAMLVAEDPAGKESDAKKRVGKAIHTLLLSMNNPLASKVSQSIDSSNVPDWLRNPESKVSANIPNRWVVWEMFNQKAPKAVKETTTRLGKTRAGAIGIAVELEKDTAKMAGQGYAPEQVQPKTMFKIVRKGAAEKVALHAPRVRHMIDEAVKEFPELKKAKPILEHAIRSGEVETDFRNAPKQTEIAKRMTDGMKITIEGETFVFHEVPILKANSSSHELAFAHGTVFNELPKARKAKVAQALFTLENYVSLLGLQVDCDRHGGQVIVDGNTIYLLDRGGMDLEPPTPKDKKLLGHCVAMALNEDLRSDMPLHEAFPHAVDSTADTHGNINPYLATVTRGQHNLGDIRREITPEQQMRSMTAVFGAGQVDKVIQDSVVEALAMPKKLWLAENIAKGKEKGNAKKVIIYDPNIEKRKQPLPPSDHVMVDEGEWVAKTQRPNHPHGTKGNDSQPDQPVSKPLPSNASWATRRVLSSLDVGKTTPTSQV